MTQVLKNKADNAIRKARAIQHTRQFTANPIKKDPTVSDILNEIPYYTAMMRRLNDIGIAVDRLGTMTGDVTPEIQHVTRNLPFMNLATRALDFIQIPFLYMMCFIMGKKAPITLKNNLRWLYAAVIFGLFLTAFTAPITAPFIAVIVAFTILTVTAVTLGQLLQQYRVNKSLIAELTTSIDTEMAKLHLIQQQAQALENSLLKASSDEDIIAIISKIDALSLEYSSQTTLIQTLHDKKNECEEKQKIESSVINNGLTILVYTLTTIGAITAFFFPPVGLSIMIAAGLINAGYAIAQIALFLSTKKQTDDVIQNEDISNQSTSSILMKIAPLHPTSTKDIRQSETVENIEQPALDEASVEEVLQPETINDTQSSENEYFDIKCK